MAEFDAESSERCERVDDEATAITGVVISVVGVAPGLDGAVDADRMRNPLVFASGEGFAMLQPGKRIAERTSRKGLLHYDVSSLASRPAVHP
ncbi:hypothetical protein HUG10_19610 (plasmid) [Halorarum halophilum]|uniref:Uncharacterized protein n=1 Tax=Halorarum halophilum TaxID=2743090 RepID=A0A7D5K3N5_9EURY|nr:hypothetical protein HUG10_19610 [Halobaculum halophilum]